jgi:uncharacterized phiE125 gp8 family phage protein
MMAIDPVDPVDGEGVVPMAALKLFLRVDGDDEDGLIGQLRLAAIGWVERHVAVGLTRRGWRWTLDGFGAVPLRFPRRPVPADAVTAITYRAPGAAAWTTLAPEAWLADGGALIAAPGTCWPDAVAVSILFEAGHADVASEAPGLVTAVMMLVAHWHGNRAPVVTGTSASDVPMTVTALCDAHRLPVIG